MKPCRNFSTIPLHSRIDSVNIASVTFPAYGYAEPITITLCIWTWDTTRHLTNISPTSVLSNQDHKLANTKPFDYTLFRCHIIIEHTLYIMRCRETFQTASSRPHTRHKATQQTISFFSLPPKYPRGPATKQILISHHCYPVLLIRNSTLESAPSRRTQEYSLLVSIL